MIISSNMKAEIEADIAKSEAQTECKGSEALYSVLVAKYSVIDADFSKGISINGKATIIGSEFDYRQELKAIAAKLRMWLLAFLPQEKDAVIPTTPKAKVDDFIKRGKEIKASEFHPAQGGFHISYVSGPEYSAWMDEIFIFCERYLTKHPLYNRIYTTYGYRNKKPSSCDDMLGLLYALSTDDEYFSFAPAEINNERGDLGKMISKKIFIVHGHDTSAKLETARTLEKCGLEAIILHEQPNAGKTIIEKIEEYSDVAFAVVLYTPCDIGRPKESEPKDEKGRARQNVVFEHGYLIGKLGRDNVCALVKGDVETPSDITGVVYIDMDDGGAWKFQLAREMINAKLNVDIKRLL